MIDRQYLTRGQMRVVTLPDGVQGAASEGSARAAMSLAYSANTTLV